MYGWGDGKVWFRMFTTAQQLAAELNERGYTTDLDHEFDGDVCVILEDARARPVGIRVYHFGRDRQGQDVGIRWAVDSTWYNRESDISPSDLADEVIGSIVFEPTRYLSQLQVAERIGVSPNSLSRYKLPPADVVIGPVNADGTLPRGTVRGWLAETIDRWNAARPGQGTRTDLRQHAVIHKARRSRGRPRRPH